MSAWICLSSSTWAIFSWSSSSISWRNSLRFFSSFSAALTSWSSRCFSRSNPSVFCLSNTRSKSQTLQFRQILHVPQNQPYVFKRFELSKYDPFFPFVRHKSRHFFLIFNQREKKRTLLKEPGSLYHYIWMVTLCKALFCSYIRRWCVTVYGTYGIPHLSAPLMTIMYMYVLIRQLLKYIDLKIVYILFNDYLVQ